MWVITNIKRNFDNFIKDNGHPILIARSAKIKKCNCWNDKTKTASQKCIRCFGLGNIAILEEHLTRTTMEPIPQTLSLAMDGNEPGKDYGASRVFYFTTETQLHRGDYILNCELPNAKSPAIDDYIVFAINTVDVVRESGGKAAFIRAFTSIDKANMQFKIGNMLQTSNGKSYLAGVK